MDKRKLIFNTELRIEDEADDLKVEGFFNINIPEDMEESLEYAIIKILHRERTYALIMQQAVSRYAGMKMVMTDEQIDEVLNSESEPFDEVNFD